MSAPITSADALGILCTWGDANRANPKGDADGKSASFLRVNGYDMERVGLDMPVHPLNNAQKKQRQVGRERAWYGGLADTSEAIALFRDGWQDGAQRAQTLANTAGEGVEGVESIRSTLEVGDWGDTLRVDAAMAGDWDVAYTRRRPARRPGRTVVRIGVQIGGNCNMSAEQLFLCGVQLPVIVDELERQGYRTEVHALLLVRHGRHETTTDIVLKEAEDQLRIDAMMSVAAHAGVFRSIGFGVMMHHPVNLGPGLGHAVAAHEAQAHVERAVGRGWLAPLDVWVGPAYTMADAVKGIQQALTNAVKVLHGTPEEVEV